MTLGNHLLFLGSRPLCGKRKPGIDGLPGTGSAPRGMEPRILQKAEGGVWMGSRRAMPPLHLESPAQFQDGGWDPTANSDWCQEGPWLVAAVAPRHCRLCLGSHTRGGKWPQLLLQCRQAASGLSQRGCPGLGNRFIGILGAGHFHGSMPGVAALWLCCSSAWRPRTAHVGTHSVWSPVLAKRTANVCLFLLLLFLLALPFLPCKWLKSCSGSGFV